MHTEEKKSSVNKAAIKRYAFALFLGVMLMIAICLIGAVIIRAGTLPERSAVSISLASVFFASLLSAFVVSRKGKGRRLPCALITALFYMAARIILTAASDKGRFFGKEMLLGIVCAVIGSVFGALLKGRKKRKRRI